MIGILSSIGRRAIEGAAILVIIACAIGGYTYPDPYGDGTGRIGWGIFGGAAGLLIAGVVFGALATLYDIRDNPQQLNETMRGNIKKSN